jgi:protocatechuate 3,4-dioxygenase beta subunit
MLIRLFSFTVLLLAISHICLVESKCADTCTLSPEAVLGPYYVDQMLVRQNITEGYEGVPLSLKVTVVDTTTCQPIQWAAVDIWHCNSQGVYSGFSAESTAGMTFFRGIQFTDGNGLSTFDTIYPGWYSGRVTHIHVKVHINSTEDSEDTLDGGHVSFVGQFFFNDTITNEIGELYPYSQHSSVAKTPLEDDNIFTTYDGEDTMLSLSLVDVSKGYYGGVVAEIKLGVDSLGSTSVTPGGDTGGGQPNTSGATPTTTPSSTTTNPTSQVSTATMLYFAAYFGIFAVIFAM